LKTELDGGAIPPASTKRRLLGKQKYLEIQMKNPLVKKISVLMFKVYITWSIFADMILIAGIIALLLGYGKISF